MTRLQNYKQAEQKLEQYLRTKRLRCTHERRQILQQVMRYPHHFTAEQLVQDICEREHIAVATVYNTLLLLTDCHLLHKLPPQSGGRVAEYELVQGKGNVLRFVCTQCGREVNFKHNMVEQMLQDKQFPNFSMNNFTLTIYGTCKVCRRKIK